MQNQVFRLGLQVIYYQNIKNFQEIEDPPELSKDPRKISGPRSVSFPAEIDENSDDLPDFTKIKNLPKFTQDNESDSLVLRRLGKLKGGAISEEIFNLDPFSKVRTKSLYSKAFRCTFFGTRKKLCSLKFVQLLLLNCSWNKPMADLGFLFL